MNVRTIIHESGDGGYWAEVPALPGCATQGDTMEELLANLREAVEGYLSAGVATSNPDSKAQVMDVAL